MKRTKQFLKFLNQATQLKTLYNMETVERKLMRQLIQAVKQCEKKNKRLVMTLDIADAIIEIEKHLKK